MVVVYGRVGVKNNRTSLDDVDPDHKFIFFHSQVLLEASMMESDESELDMDWLPMIITYYESWAKPGYNTDHEGLKTVLAQNLHVSSKKQKDTKQRYLKFISSYLVNEIWYCSMPSCHYFSNTIQAYVSGIHCYYKRWLT